MKQKKKMLFAVISAFAISVMILTGCGDGKDSSITESAKQSASSDSSKIDIPGFESVTLKADETEQTTPFFNPENNVCLFRLTLSVEGEDIWTSDYISPGEKAESMMLSHELTAGEYQAKLKYDCFTIEDKSPLNGAEIDLTVKVK